MTSKYSQEIPNIIKAIHDSPEDEQIETLHIYPMDGGIFISKEDLERTVIAKNPKPLFIEKRTFVLLLSVFCLFLFLDSWDFYFTSPPAVVVITPRSLSLSLAENLYPVKANPNQNQIVMRTLHPLSISQTKVVSASGRGHQNASYASGFITFYNGLLTPQFVPEGTLITGSDKVVVRISKSASIPPANPPLEGSVTVSAFAVQIGSSGNISARDIDSAVNVGVLAVNASSFSGGVDARDFHFVTSQDIKSGIDALKQSEAQSIRRYFLSRLDRGESLISPHCALASFANHQAGDEGNSVSVSLSETCADVSYKTDEVVMRGEQAVQHIILASFASYAPLENPKVITLYVGQDYISIRIRVQLQMIINRGQVISLIRGKRRTEALKLLSVFSFHVSIYGSDPMPIDGNEITIVVKR